jgi:hypothetical protein
MHGALLAPNQQMVTPLGVRVWFRSEHFHKLVERLANHDQDHRRLIRVLLCYRSNGMFRKIGSELQPFLSHEQIFDVPIRPIYRVIFIT